MTGFAAFIVGLFGFLLGWSQGIESGREQIHTKEYTCQTLPDNTIHCWKVKTPKAQNETDS